MAATIITRKFEVFAVHCTIESSPAPYRALMEYLSGLERKNRVYEFSDKILAIPEFERVGSRYRIAAFEGPKGVNPLIFDATTATPRKEKLRRGEFMAQKTHAFLDIDDRRIAVEYVKAGAKAYDLATAIEGLASEHTRFKGVQVEFAPIPDENFWSQIIGLERIREAHISVVRPNAGFSDHYTRLSGLIEDSNGRAADFGVRAGKGRSLRKNNGIVRVIKEIIDDPQPYLRGVTVIGRRPQEDVETRISLTRNKKQRKAKVSTDTDGHVLDNDAFQELEKTLREAKRVK